MFPRLLGLLPWAVPSALAWGWWRRGDRPGMALGKALLAWAGAVWIFSETASAFGRLDLQAALLFWVVAAGAALAWAAAGQPARPAAAALDKAALAALLGLGLVLAFLALLGLRCPVTNFDAMLYHLPRVEQWAQNHSLALFPASYDLQDFYPPWAETAVLQSRLLAMDNFWASLVQWAALVGACAGVAELALALGGGAWAAVFAALSLAALPMANLESSTCQTDLAAALWLAWAAVFTLRHWRAGTWSDAAWAAAALGLALATKGTSYVYGLPWGLWLAWSVLRRGPLAKPWLPALLALLIVAPNLGPWTRNHRASGGWLGSSSDHQVARLDFAGAASNVVKNLSYDAFSNKKAWNVAVVAAVKGLHARLGWDLNDPALLWGNLEYNHYDWLAGLWHDDYAGSPWHLLAGALLALAVALGWRRAGALPWALAALAAGYLAYAVLIRFNPWCNRLHLPVFALLCGPLGVGLEAMVASRWRGAAAAVLVGYAALIAVHHASQPWPSVLPGEPERIQVRADFWRSGLFAGWRAASLGKQVGLLTQERALEYPLWVGLENGGARRIQHLVTTTATASTLQDPLFSGFQPEVIVSDWSGNSLVSKPALRLDWGGRRWQRDLITEGWVVYQAAPAKK